MSKNKQLPSAEQTKTLLDILEKRFEKNLHRHKNVEWKKVEDKLHTYPDKLFTIYQMVETGGEPDVVLFDTKQKEFIFFDCSTESPKGRRSLCYDDAALHSRKEHKPKNSAVKMAEEMGVELLTEQQYRALQELENFDLKTSSWIRTPENIRKLGGALFCDRRYNAVFTYHNGAESYYGSRGFRGMVKLS